MQTGAFVPLGNMRETMCCFEGKFFVDLHNDRRFVGNERPQCYRESRFKYSWIDI